MTDRGIQNGGKVTVTVAPVTGFMSVNATPESSAPNSAGK